MIGSKKPIKCKYKMHGQVLGTVTSAKYLGIDLLSDMSLTEQQEMQIELWALLKQISKLISLA